MDIKLGGEDAKNVISVETPERRVLVLDCQEKGIIIETRRKLDGSKKEIMHSLYLTPETTEMLACALSRLGDLNSLFGEGAGRTFDRSDQNEVVLFSGTSEQWKDRERKKREALKKYMDGKENQ